MKKVFFIIGLLLFLMCIVGVIPILITLNNLVITDETTGEVTNVSREIFSARTKPFNRPYFVITLSNNNKPIRVRDGSFIAPNFMDQLQNEPVNIRYRDMGDYYLGLHVNNSSTVLLNYEEYADSVRRTSYANIATVSLPFIFSIFMFVIGLALPKQRRPLE